MTQNSLTTVTGRNSLGGHLIPLADALRAAERGRRVGGRTDR